MHEYLKGYKEDVPTWLKEYRMGNSVAFSTVMDGRVGYYPGSGFDGNLVSVANRAHCVHSYLYVDYLVKKSELEGEMDRNSFRGYHSIGRIEWTERDLMPNGQYPLKVDYIPRRHPRMFIRKTEKPYCFTEILERDVDRGEDYGAERFAITFLFADGISTYYQLFVKQLQKAPWIFLLQDHGFGCNYDRFGRGGMLDKIIEESHIRPRFVIAEPHPVVWKGYDKLESVAHTFGGMHKLERCLYVDHESQWASMVDHMIEDSKKDNGTRHNVGQIMKWIPRMWRWRKQYRMI